MNTLKNKILWIGIALVMIATLLLTVIVPNVKKLTMSDEERLTMTYREFTEEDYQTQSENVRFLAYFAKDIDGDGYMNKLAGTTKDVTQGDSLFFEFNVVSDGTLENGVITIGESNFKLGMNYAKNNVLAQNYINAKNVKMINLKNIRAGAPTIIGGSISADLKDNINNFSKITTVTLTGTYVASDGTETAINKTVDLTVDWHGVANTRLESYSSTEHIIYDDPKSTFNFSFVAAEKVGKLPIKSTGAIIKIPDFCGVYPTDVQCENGTYNEETHTVTIRRERQADSNGKILVPLASENKYTIKVTYPEYVWDRVDFENYEDTYLKLNFNVTAYYEVYNNPNYTNPYISYDTQDCVKMLNIDRGEPVPPGGYEIDFADKEYRSRNRDYVYDKQKLLEAYDNNEDYYYTVMYHIQAPQNESLSKARLTNIDPDYLGVHDLWYSSNCYGVYVYGFDEALGENGKINIYNVVDNQANPGVEMSEIEEQAGVIRKNTTEGDILASSNLQNPEQLEEYLASRQAGKGFTKNNPYIIGGENQGSLNTAAKKITIETSEIKANSNLWIYVIKKIDMSMLRDTLSRAQVNSAAYMTSNVRGGGNLTNSKISTSVTLVDTKSYATIGINEKSFIVGDPTAQVTNRTISIEASKEQVGDALWKDGIFVVEMPKEIIKMD